MSLLELFCDYNKYYHIQTSFPETLSIRLLMATISMSPTVPHNNLSVIEKKKLSDIHIAYFLQPS